MAQRTWLDDSPYDVLERNLLRLGKTMLVGAILDVLFASVGFFFPGLLARWMGMPGPVDRFAFYQWAMAHMVFACFCVLAWLDVKRNIVIVGGAILTRSFDAMLMLVLVLFFDVPAGWLVLGGVSLALAVVHLILLRMSDFGLWEVLARAGNPPGFSPRTRIQERSEMRDQ